MTSEGLGEMFEGDSADTEGLACADPVARTPIGMSRNVFTFHVDLKVSACK